jgi:hypothetical protein
VARRTYPTLEAGTFHGRQRHEPRYVARAYATHRDIIEWNARFSEDRISEQAVGVNPVTARPVRWALASWPRVRSLNTWLGRKVMPRLQLDLAPGLGCAWHPALVAERPPANIDDSVSTARALQRQWLTATSPGLYMQLEVTPVIFSHYVQEERRFTQVDSVNARARHLVERMAVKVSTPNRCHATDRLWPVSLLADPAQAA